MKASDIRWAARLLREHARAIRDAETVDGKWPAPADCDPARADYETHIALARGLEAMAKERKA